MENENMERIVLNDEELKEVAGGKISGEAVINTVKRMCSSSYSREACVRKADCAWVSDRCLPNPSRYEYDYKSGI
jgi:hypothetical protein